MFESIRYFLPRILSNSFSSTIKLLWIRNSLLDNLLTTIRLNSQLFLPVTSLSAVVQSLTSNQFLWTLAEPLNFVLVEIYLCRDMSWTCYLLISDIHRKSIRLTQYAINGWAFFYKKMLLHHVLKMIQVIPKLDTRIWHWKLEVASIAIHSLHLGRPYFFSHGKTFNKNKGEVISLMHFLSNLIAALDTGLIWFVAIHTLTCLTTIPQRMKMREASEREANGAEKTEKKTERERELLICPELVLYSCMNSIFLHEQFMTH